MQYALNSLLVISIGVVDVIHMPRTNFPSPFGPQGYVSER